MKTPISSGCARGQRPCIPCLKPKSTWWTPWIALLGVLEIAVCWYTALKCYVRYLAGTFRCGLHVLWKALLYSRQEKGGSEGAQIATIGLGNPLPDCVEQESCSWRWWGEISPFGSVSEAWNAVPPSVPTPQGWIFPLLSLASVIFIRAKILPWIFQICIISTNYFLFSFRCKKTFWLADLLSEELFKRSRSSMYCTYYSHALAFVLRL